MSYLHLLPEELILEVYKILRKDSAKLREVSDLYDKTYLKMMNLIGQGKIDPDDYFDEIIPFADFFNVEDVTKLAYYKVYAEITDSGDFYYDSYTAIFKVKYKDEDKVYYKIIFHEEDIHVGNTTQQSHCDTWEYMWNGLDSDHQKVILKRNDYM